MKQTFLAIENKYGQTARVVPFSQQNVEVVYRQDLKRIEIVSSLQELTDAEIPFEHLGRVPKSSKPGDLIVKGPWGRIRHVVKVQDTLKDVKEREEQGPEFNTFLKWTTIAQVSAVVLVIALAWVIERFSNEKPQVVKVFRRPIVEKQVVPTVDVSKTKVTKSKQIRASRKRVKTPSRKLVRNSHRKTRGKNIRAGNDVRRMGALSALGGMNKSAKGLGGLSTAKTNTSGFGFDKAKAAGGHRRGMIGKGLIHGGIGGSESLKGYDGYGTKGRGQGQGGYGVVKLAGQTGGYFLPLGEEASIEGGLDRDQINAVIQRNLGQVTYCYERGLQVKPRLSGRVAVKFTIAPNGNVSIANVAHTSLDSSRVESCILAKLKSWKFPKPKGNVAVRVTYPFILKRLNQG